MFSLFPGKEAEYDRVHQAVWPDLLKELTAAGVHNYTIFRRGTQVIAYAECEPDAATAFGRVGQTEVNKRWGQGLRDVIDRSGAADLVAAGSVPEVWHLD
jgi:L-rhamnose mutarotase